MLHLGVICPVSKDGRPPTQITSWFGPEIELERVREEGRQKEGGGVNEWCVYTLEVYTCIQLCIICTYIYTYMYMYVYFL